MVKFSSCLIMFALAAAPQQAESANILCVIHAPLFSHQIVLRSLSSALADRGHNLTILSPIPGLNHHPNVTEINLESSLEIWEEHFNFVQMKEAKVSRYETLLKTAIFGPKLFEHQLSLPAVQELIATASTRHFDLVILEYIYFTPALAFAELFKCPAIGISALDASLSVHEMFGHPTNPVIHPDASMFSYEHSRLNFMQRISSFIFHFFFKFIKSNADNGLMKIARSSFPNSSATLQQLEDKVALVFVNTHPYLAVRPLVPKVVQLGFLHIKPAKPLPDGDLKDFLDSSTHGVIYMSFGTIVKAKDLSVGRIQIFLNVFSKLKYDVLWKFEADEMPNKPKNVMIRKWLPQADVLAHPKVILIIGQGGLLTIEEAIDREVPLVSIPFVEEHLGNALKITRKRVGNILDFHSLSEETLRAVIDETLKPVYKKNIEKLKRILNDQPMTSLEKAVWWTEHVIRNNGSSDHLEYEGRLVPFYQKVYLDIFAFIVVCIIVMWTAFKFLLKKIICFKKKKLE